MAAQLIPAFADFISGLRTIWAEKADDESRMKAAQLLMCELLQDEELKSHSENWPSTEGHKNLLFYEDPDYGFVINGVVRAPNRTGSVHDHDHAWVLYGLLSGTESLERFERVDDGSKPGYAEVRLTGVTQGQPGNSDLVPPYDIHAEQGGPGRSVAVILRSARVAGRVLQGRYRPDSNEYFKGEGPTQVPYELSR